MNRQCTGVKRDGSRCTATVEPPNEYCWWHDPANAEQRKRAAAKGGKSKPNRELAEIKARLRELAEDVMAGRVNRASAAIAGQLYNTVIRAVGVELKVREQQDLIERLEELEALLERQDKRGKYGA